MSDYDEDTFEEEGSSSMFTVIIISAVAVVAVAAAVIIACCCCCKGEDEEVEFFFGLVIELYFADEWAVLNYKLAMSELLFLTQTRYCGLPFVWFLLRPLFLFGGV